VRLAASAYIATLPAAWGGTTGGKSAATSQVLRFTAIPNQNTTELERKFEPVAAYLANKLGVKVEYVPSICYPASREMFKNGEVMMAWFGGFTGVQARHDVRGAHAIVMGVEDPKFFSYFIAHKDTGLERSDEFPKEIAKLKFTFGSPGSTSGRLMPWYFITKLGGADPMKFFATTPAFSGAHDRTAVQVQAGRMQAGVLDYTVYERMVKEGKIDPRVCRVIWKTPEYADYNMTAHPDIDRAFGAGFTRRIQSALVEMKDPKLLAAFDRTGMIPAKDEDFAAIKQAAESLGMIG
jgi:phosphonate transport system substrate-binding protein